MNFKIILQLRISHLFPLLIATLTSACQGDLDINAAQYPSDSQVIIDVTPSNKIGLIGVSVNNEEINDAYLHDKDLLWYWDRGVTIKRKANIHGAPEAIVIIEGIARYQRTGDKYLYTKFLTSHNQYEGIPAPGNRNLIEFINNHLPMVFSDRDHEIVNVSTITYNKDNKFNWYSATSFSAFFTIKYQEITANTKVREREDVFYIRFYRDTMDSPVNTLVATEIKRNILKVRDYSLLEIHKLKTLNTRLL